MKRVVIPLVALALLAASTSCKPTPEKLGIKYAKMAEDKYAAKVYDEAIYLYKMAIDQKKDINWCLRLGDIVSEADPANWKESIGYYMMAIQQDTNNLDLFYKVADIYINKGLTNEGFTVLKVIMRKGGQQKDLLARFGLGFQAVKLEEEARFAFNEALKLDPNNEIAKKNLAELDKMSTLIMDEWKAARMYFDMKQYEQAVVTYQSLLAVRPFEAALYDEIIKTYKASLAHYKEKDTKENIRNLLKEMTEQRDMALKQKQRMDTLTDEEKRTAIMQGMSFFDYLVQLEEGGQ